MHPFVMAPKPREGTDDSHCAGCSSPSTSAVDGPASYGGMTGRHNARHNEDSIWLDRAAPVTKASHGGLDDDDDVLVVEMFAKELTPSDVGKLNRLVIPKKHAMQHFSAAAPTTTEEELSIRFVDKDSRRWWTFRYCYWKSSQSFVFTKGWNRFVKEKRLRAKDTVAFYRCDERRNGLRRTYCLIDTIQQQSAENEDDKTPKDGLSWSTSEGKGLGLSFKRRMKQQQEDDQVEFTRNIMKTKYGDGEVVPMAESKKKLKLFGEWIKIE